jgi:hypothetical protein
MNAWWLYLASSFALMIFMLFVGYKTLSAKWLIYLGLLLPAILFIPAVVPGTAALAPAWFIVIFESLFGEASNAIQASKPLLLTILLLHVALLISHLVARRQASA